MLRFFIFPNLQRVFKAMPIEKFFLIPNRRIEELFSHFAECIQIRLLS